MPSIFTHYITGGKVYEKLSAEARSLIEPNRRIFDFGLQGPDFFRYYGAPFHSDEAITRLSMLLHERTVDEWLSTIYRYIKTQAPEDFAILAPYFLGYLVHYQIDQAVNPYVSYRVGFPTPGMELAQRFNVYRDMFNTALDTQVLAHYENKTPDQMDIDKIFWVDYSELLEICRLYPVHLKRIMGREVSREQVIKAAQDMNSLAKKRINPGLLKFAASLYEILSRDSHPGEFTASVYAAPDPAIDYLNQSHTAWSLPWDAKAQFTTDVIQMLENGIMKATELVEDIARGLQGEGSDLLHIEKMGKNSFLTGVAWNAPFLPRFYDCVYKAEEEKAAKKIAKMKKE